MRDRSKLFDRPGYIPVKEYLEDVAQMKGLGPWKLPLHYGDRFHLFFLSVVTKISWFSDVLYILHPYIWSPSYGIILSYLKKKGFLDGVYVRDIRYGGYFSYYIKKEVTDDDNRIWILNGQGVSDTKERALSKSIGEIIERVVSGLNDCNKNILHTSPARLLGKYSIYYPPQHHRFLDVQKKKYPELRHDSSEAIDWVEGLNLVTKQKAYIPRHITSWFIGARSSEAVLMNSTTNGSAGYFTKTGAVLRGLLEIIHRDGFLVHWLTTLAPRVIRNETLPEPFQKIIKNFESLGISLYVLDVTSLSIPSVYIAAISEQIDDSQIVLSGASATTIERAIRDGLEEMIAISPGVFYKETDNSKKSEAAVFEPFISGLSRDSRQSFWQGKEKLKQFRWFLSGELVSYDEAEKHDLVSQADEASQLITCIDALKARGTDYYPIVYFPKNNIQQELGFYIAQVFIPKAFPLHLLESRGNFDSDRLDEFAQSKGRSQWSLNPLPHMFT